MDHPYLFYLIAEQQRSERMREVEQWRLARSLPQSAWLSEQAGGLLLRLGYWLIRIGQQSRQTACCQQQRLTP